MKINIFNKQKKFEEEVLSRVNMPLGYGIFQLL